MGSKKEHKEASEFLDNLVEFYSSFDNLSLDELKEELREDGFDPEALLVRAKGLIDSKIRNAKKHAWKEEARRKRISWKKQFSKKEVEVPENISELKKGISDFVKGRHGSDVQHQASAFFRNLEEVTDDDLKSLYEDFIRLRLLNEGSDENEG